ARRLILAGARFRGISPTPVVEGFLKLSFQPLGQVQIVVPDGRIRIARSRVPLDRPADALQELQGHLQGEAGIDLAEALPIRVRRGLGGQSFLDFHQPVAQAHETFLPLTPAAPRASRSSSSATRASLSPASFRRTCSSTMRRAADRRTASLWARSSCRSVEEAAAIVADSRPRARSTMRVRSAFNRWRNVGSSSRLATVASPSPALRAAWR